ncbi:MAG TPA: hypothetical protein DEG71_06140 [Clostridiales bacterium]|nr:hypothetical protein [Clostridiales bacterium]
MQNNNIIMEEVLEVDENEVKEVLDVLDSHKQILDIHEKKIVNHDDKIHGLEAKNYGYDERFNSVDIQFDSIKTTLVRFESNYLQSASSMTNLMTQIFLNTNNNNTEIIKTKDTNETEVMKIRLGNRANITLKILAIIGGVISTITIGYFALKGVSIPKLM